MSLKDTLLGAAQEAKENAQSLKKTDDQTQESDAGDKNAGVLPKRASAASAKPASEAASSVRSSSGTTKRAPQTKEEKRAQRARERERQDLRQRGYDLILKNDPEYARTDRVWWIVLGFGMVVTVIALVASQFFKDANDYSTNLGMVVAVSMILAYVLIIGAFIYDLVKRRPIRRRAEAQAARLSDKKIIQMMEQARAEGEAKRAAKRKK